jgi:hypothetical protein
MNQINNSFPKFGAQTFQSAATPELAAGPDFKGNRFIAFDVVLTVGPTITPFISRGQFPRFNPC